jgi:hypothetical protein
VDETHDATHDFFLTSSTAAAVGADAAMGALRSAGALRALDSPAGVTLI